MGQKADGKSPFEKMYRRKPNIVNSITVDKIKNVSETDPMVAFNISDFEEEIHSTFLVREKKQKI